jgi:hypothetical protein
MRLSNNTILGTVLLLLVAGLFWQTRLANQSNKETIVTESADEKATRIARSIIEGDSELAKSLHSGFEVIEVALKKSGNFDQQVLNTVGSGLVINKLLSVSSKEDVIGIYREWCVLQNKAYDPKFEDVVAACQTPKVKQMNDSITRTLTE